MIGGPMLGGQYYGLYGIETIEVPSIIPELPILCLTSKARALCAVEATAINCTVRAVSTRVKVKLVGISVIGAHRLLISEMIVRSSMTSAAVTCQSRVTYTDVTVDYGSPMKPEAPEITADLETWQRVESSGVLTRCQVVAETQSRCKVEDAGIETCCAKDGELCASH